MNDEIPTEKRAQPRLVVGDFPGSIDPAKKLEPVAVELPTAHPTLAEPPTLIRLGDVVEDALAAAHGVRKFRVKFADAEVLEKLDAAAETEAYYITIHFIDKGRIMHFLKPSDRFPTLDVAKCAAAVQEDARRRIKALQEHIATGLNSLEGDRQPIEDEKD